jgi:hypothetical protein
VNAGAEPTNEGRLASGHFHVVERMPVSDEDPRRVVVTWTNPSYQVGHSGGRAAMFGKKQWQFASGALGRIAPSWSRAIGEPSHQSMLVHG